MTGHFGWGFRLLDAALYFAALVPIVLLIETVCIVVKIVRVVRAKEAPAVVQTLAMYIVSAWLLWILSLLILIN